MTAEEKVITQKMLTSEKGKLTKIGEMLMLFLSFF